MGPDKRPMDLYSIQREQSPEEKFKRRATFKELIEKNKIQEKKRKKMKGGKEGGKETEKERERGKNDGWKEGRKEDRKNGWKE